MPTWYHYTDKESYDLIRSQPTWKFRASHPPGEHPLGAYFTTKPPETRGLARSLRLPRRKLAYVFAFSGADDLTPLPGGRGEFVSYFPGDYDVPKERQLFTQEIGQ